MPAPGQRLDRGAARDGDERVVELQVVLRGVAVRADGLRDDRFARQEAAFGQRRCK